MGGRITQSGAGAALTRSVDATLQSYADRGVFQRFSVADRPRGERRYQFLWLTRRPMTVRFTPDRRMLTFDALFPAARSVAGVAAALQREVGGRTSAARVAHRRIDARRARIASPIRSGTISLEVDIRGRNGEYAVRSALNLVNDLFLLLHEHYPEYLASQFGVSAE